MLVNNFILCCTTTYNFAINEIALGVVASIVPFNFPLMVPLWTLSVAIVMGTVSQLYFGMTKRIQQNKFTQTTRTLPYILIGNTMVLKPSEKVPFTMSKIAELLKEAGLPDGVINLVNGTAEGKDTTNLK